MAEQPPSRGKDLDKDNELRRPLNNLINRMPEFDYFLARSAKRWTLPMAAAWFIWRDFAAVDDQWRIVTRKWWPFDSPLFPLDRDRRHPGTLTCVFQQAGYARGKRPYRRIEEIDDLPSSMTTDPYERLRFALQSGRLRATIFEDSADEGGSTKLEWGTDDWLDFDNLADPTKHAPFHYLSDPGRFAVLVSREDTIKFEAELSEAEAERLFWKVEQVLGWIAYRRDRSFRSLGRIDLQPPTFFGHRFSEKDLVEPSPLATLTSALLSEKVHAYMQGAMLTRAECIALLSSEDGLWDRNDLVFVPDEVRGIWQRQAEINPKISVENRDRALTELIELLKEAKGQEIRVRHEDAERWMSRIHQIKGKAFDAIWREARKHPDVGGDRGGRPNAAQQKASASFCESYPKSLPTNPEK
jgi:hypothetical protein